MTLQISNISAGYTDDVDIVHDVSAEFERGRVSLIIGPNGAGKSTLLKSIMGITKIKSGKVAVDGHDVTAVGPARVVRNGVVYVPQERSVFGHMAVHENLLMGAWTMRNKRSLIQAKLESVTKIFPILISKRREKAVRLSGGQQKVLEVSRGLMVNTKYILLDEPTTGLAPVVAHQLYSEVRELTKQDIGCVIVDQNIRESLEIADYVYLLELGIIKDEGPIDQFSKKIEDIVKDWLK